MHELFKIVQTYIFGVLRFKWLAILVAWVTFISGAFFIFSMPNQYQAKASFFINTDSVMRPLLVGLAIQPDVVSRLNVVAKAVLSRPNLEAVIKETDLDLRVHNEIELSELTKALEKNITIRPRREHVYDIEFIDQSPEVAYQVVDVVLNNVLEKTLSGKRDDNTVAQNFLLQQIEDYETRLTEAEKRLADFKKENIGLMPGSNSDYFRDLQDAQTALSAAQFQLRLASEKRNALRKQVEGEEPVFGLSGLESGRNSNSPTALRIAQLQADLNDALYKYTELHPQVVSIKETIQDLEEQLLIEQQNDLLSPQLMEDSNVKANPVYQTMQIALKRAEVEVASYRAEVSQHAGRVSKLKKSVDTVPEVEAQLARLNRDYNVTKAQYESLLERLETAKLSEEADNSNKDVKFQVINPPVVPLSPVGPYRSLLLVLLLFVSLGAGVALAFIVDQLKPVFFDSEGLNRHTGIPVLGSIPMEMKASEIAAKRMKNFGFLAVLGLLFGVFLIGVTQADLGAAYVAQLMQSGQL